MAKKDDVLERIKKEHPLYRRYKDDVYNYINFYKNDNSCLDEIIQHTKESNSNYKNRKDRSIRINYLKSIVDLTVKAVYSFKNVITRKMPEKLEKYINNVDNRGIDVKDFMRRILRRAYVNKQCYVWIDNFNVNKSVYTQNDIEENNMRPYVKILGFLDITNWSKDIYGNFNWVVIKLKIRKDKNPFAEIEDKDHWLLYTKEKWVLYDDDGAVKRGKNEINFVPIIPIYVQDIDDDGMGESPVTDLYHLDIQCMNTLSAYNWEFYTNLFNFLALPGNPEDYKTNSENQVNLSEKTILTFPSDSQQVPRWLSPNTNTLEEKRTYVGFLVNEMIRISGFKGREEAFVKSASASQSGISKLMDFENVLETLIAIVSNLEIFEKRVWYCFALYDNLFNHSMKNMEKFLSKDCEVFYPKTFDLFNLDKDIEHLFKLSQSDFSLECSKESAIMLAKKILGDSITNDKLNKIVKSISTDFEENYNKEVENVDFENNKLNESFLATHNKVKSENEKLLSDTAGKSNENVNLLPSELGGITNKEVKRREKNKKKKEEKKL